MVSDDHYRHSDAHDALPHDDTGIHQNHQGPYVDDAGESEHDAHNPSYPYEGHSDTYDDEYDDYYDEEETVPQRVGRIAREYFVRGFYWVVDRVPPAVGDKLVLARERVAAVPPLWWRIVGIVVLLFFILFGFYWILSGKGADVVSSGGISTSQDSGSINQAASASAAFADAVASDNAAALADSSSGVGSEDDPTAFPNDTTGFPEIATESDTSTASSDTSSGTTSGNSSTPTIVYTGGSTGSPTQSNVFTPDAGGTGTSGDSGNGTSSTAGDDSSNTTTNNITTSTPTAPPPTTVIATVTNAPPALSNTGVANVTVGGTGVTQYYYRVDGSGFLGPYVVSQPISLNVSDGTHTLSVIGGDANGLFQAENNATAVVWAVDSVAPTANIVGISTDFINTSNTTLSVGGAGVTQYRYSLDGAAYSVEQPVAQVIGLSGLSEGQHTIRVIGRDAAGNYQAESNASFITWTNDTNAPITSGFTIFAQNNQATFDWTTSEATTATVEVGLSEDNYTYSDTAGAGFNQSLHNFVVPNLQSCSTFRYRIRSTDPADQTAEQTGTFNTDGCTGAAEIIAQTDSFISYNIGGSLQLLDNSGRGITLTVPAFFASQQNAQFQIKKMEKDAYVAGLEGPGDVSRVGDYIYRLSALRDISTLISSFDQDITVRIYYSLEDLHGVPETSLTIRRHDGVKWNKLSNCGVNTQAKYVTCTTDHFSDFELFGETPKNLTFVSDTLSDSDLGVASNHTVRFTSGNVVNAGEVVALAFDDLNDRFDGWENLTFADVTYSGATLVETCGAGNDEVTMTVRTDTENEGVRFTVCPGDSIATGAKVITIGGLKITNPSIAGSYEIKIRSGSDDNADEYASAYVAIIDDVVVTAIVDTALEFVVVGVASGQANANDTGNTTVTTTSTAIPWGELTPNVPKTARQDLQVSTNARNGFTVSLYQDQNLTSATGADIDTFQNGDNPSSPTAWTSPTGNVGQENTYGHFGVTSADENLAAGDSFGAALYDAIGSITNPLEVFYHTGPSDGATTHKGVTNIGFKIETTALQEAAGDYTSNLTYIVTPVF